VHGNTYIGTDGLSVHVEYGAIDSVTRSTEMTPVDRNDVV